ncbi:hypothetical protein BGZ61DRAFT_355428 [Ilyonectria robusta]|uniref:uncharacterized protein n=1 Tax=Ilyonectria robusta TaxID=1079257 RepID=UPI001E8D7B1C|nr:uncharacterized protein BGZ61DRAFT_355428 [Ilyonectria robusta]KAH8686530.1 hypothetical protein BGZ61DRAFT_355428 [Ilyonectria robusta]
MNNEAFCREADKCYARALQIQQSCVRRHSQTSQNTLEATRNVPTEQDICASLLLMYYELLKPTAIGSWMTHMRGTVALLMLSGPEKCQQGSYHLMFRSLRLLMAHVSIRSGLPSCFASSEWRIVPFSQCQKTGVDTLLDVIYNLSSMLKPSNIEQPTEWTARIQMLIDAVFQSEKLWDEMSAKQTLGHRPPLSLGEAGELDDRLWLGGGDFCSTTSSTVYHAVWIMIYHLMLTGVECNQLMRNESMARCSSILDFAHGLFTRSLQDRLNAGSCIQLVFPIEVVSCYSPCEHQREQARTFLDRLGWVQLSSELLE